VGFPTEKELKKVRDELNSAEASFTLPSNATKTQIIKYKICEKFVKYLLENKMSQAEFARQAKMDPARLNEIIKYKIDLFTIDKLIEFAEAFEPEINIEVA
jgi:predicted XRE-type DNA-binding protein